MIVPVEDSQRNSDFSDLPASSEGGDPGSSKRQALRKISEKQRKLNSMSQAIQSIKVEMNAPGIGGAGVTREKARDQAIDSIIRFGSREYEIIKQLSDQGNLHDSKFGQLINLQRLINDYSLKMNMISRIAEALTTTIRKFQQQ